jgi:hypothetical protein
VFSKVLCDWGLIPASIISDPEDDTAKEEFAVGEYRFQPGTAAKQLDKKSLK